METWKRMIAKAFTYRLSASVLTFLIAFIYTNDILLSFNVASMSTVAKMVLYIVHERYWGGVGWGNINGRVKLIAHMNEALDQLSEKNYNIAASEVYRAKILLEEGETEEYIKGTTTTKRLRKLTDGD